MEKVICKCGNVAVWCYLPTDACYCDECVPRGCDCNIYNITEFELSNDIDLQDYIFYKESDIIAHMNSEITHDELFKRGIKCDDNTKDMINRFKYYEMLDKGRPFPCCEFIYEEDGWDLDDNYDNKMI